MHSARGHWPLLLLGGALGALLFSLLLPAIGGSGLALSAALACFACAASFRSEEISAPLLPLALFAAVAAAGLISQALSGVWHLYVIFGATLEWGTLGALILSGAAVAAGALLARPSHAALLWGVQAAGGVIGAAALLTLIRIPLPSLSGAAAQLALAAGAGAVAALASLPGAGHTARIFHAGVAVLSIAGMVVLFTPEAALAAFIACALGCALALARIEYRDAAFLAVAALFALGLYFGMQQPLIKVDAQPRPSLAVTQIVIGHEYADSLGNAVFGKGSGSFSSVWDRYRLPELNATPLWNFTPRQSFSDATSLAAEAGLLGLALVLLIPCAALWRAKRRSVPIALPVVALFCFAAVLLYPVGAALVVLGCLCAGACMQKNDDQLRWRPKRALARAVPAGVLLCGALLFLLSTLQLLALVNAQAGARALQSGELPDAAFYSSRAALLWETPERHRTAAIAYASAALKDPTSEEGKRDLERAIAEASDASALEPESIERYLFDATFYTELAEHGLSAPDRTPEQYVEVAVERAPERPDAYFLRARVALLRGNSAAAKEALSQALTLKPDYAEAKQLLASLGR